MSIRQALPEDLVQMQNSNLWCLPERTTTTLKYFYRAIDREYTAISCAFINHHAKIKEEIYDVNMAQRNEAENQGGLSAITCIVVLVRFFFCFFGFSF